MIQCCQEVRKLENKFDGLRFTHILHEKNVAADELSKLGASRRPVPPGVFLHIMDKPSVKFKQSTAGPTPSTDVTAQEPFLLYLRSRMLPTDKVEQHRLEIKAREHLLVDDELYRRGGPNILMKCISTTGGQELL